MPEPTVIRKLFHFLQGQNQTVEILQFGRFKICDEIQIIEPAGVVEFPFYRLNIRRRGFRMFLHHRHSLVLIQPPPVCTLTDWDHNRIGIWTWLAYDFKIGLYLVRKSRDINCFLSQAMHDGGLRQMLAKEAALKIQEELLSLAQFGRMYTKQHVRVIR